MRPRKDGSLLIPAELVRQLSVTSGDEIVVEGEETRLVIRKKARVSHLDEIARLLRAGLYDFDIAKLEADRKAADRWF
ncbi:MAG: AbrB/MazE/SpoVT family DNA-binding domain-containing protein [Anaerolineae bacterium]|nr:AbrB/MazE/SpoVT family DNA-binding domain-containing protein [Anaerolineae bacterium]